MAFRAKESVVVSGRGLDNPRSNLKQHQIKHEERTVLGNEKFCFGRESVWLSQLKERYSLGPWTQADLFAAF